MDQFKKNQLKKKNQNYKIIDPKKMIKLYICKNIKIKITLRYFWIFSK